MAAAAKLAEIGLPITFNLECLGTRTRNWLQKFRFRSLIQIKRITRAMGLVASIDAIDRRKRDYAAPTLGISICVQSVNWHSCRMAMQQRCDGRQWEGSNE
jgi:hypothetical protein